MINRAAPFAGLFDRCTNRRDATHVAFPHGGDPRFALPLNSRAGRTALRFLLPAAARAKLAWRQAAARRSGRPAWWLAATRLLDDVAALAERDTLLCTVSAGTPGPYNKPSVLFLDDAGAPASIAKVAISPASRALVANERAWLERLGRNGALRDRTPAALAAADIADAFVLVQSAGGGKFAGARLDAAHMRFLADLRTVEHDHMGYRESPMRAAMHRRFEAYRAALDRGWSRRLGEGLTRLDDTLGPIGFGMVAAHRDFAPWNIRRTPAGIFVFDWEYADWGYVPLYDLFHHMLMPRALTRGVAPVHAAKAIDRSRRLARRAAIPGDLLEACDTQLLAYLIDLSLSYIESCAAGDMQARIFVEYGRLIDRYDEWRHGP